MTLDLKRFERFKDEYLAKLTSSTIREAMIYSLDGGKRFRARLIFALLKTRSIDEKKGYHCALALEMIHAYSLIHDDLPCMDDDDMRRGKASCHIAFGEASAVLAGDALLTEAFRVITLDEDLTAAEKVSIINDYSSLAGAEGMVYGQELDLKSEGKELTKEEIITIERYKTGCLFKAATRAASRILEDDDLTFYDRLADELGIVFQMQDDLFDLTRSTEELGKPACSDLKDEKATALAIFDISELKDELDRRFAYIIGEIESHFIENFDILGLIQELKDR